MGEVTLVTPESGVPAVTLSRCHATVTREDCAFRTQSLCLQSSCTYFTPQTHRIVFVSYLFLRAIQKLELKIYSMSIRWSRPRTYQCQCAILQQIPFQVVQDEFGTLRLPTLLN